MRLTDPGLVLLRDEFQAKGYFEAEVEFKEQKLINDKAEIDYLINPGKRHQLVHIEIQGNHYFTTDSLRERMFMTPKSLQFRRGRYSDALRRTDEESIMNLYRENGFRDVQVNTKVVDDYNGKVGDIAVFVVIDEGPQWRMRGETARRSTGSRACRSFQRPLVSAVIVAVPYGGNYGHFGGAVPNTFAVRSHTSEHRAISAVE